MDDRLEHLAVGLDRLGVGLEVALRDDQVDEFVGQLDVGAFERPRLDRAEPLRARLSDEQRARRAGLRPVGVAERLQPLRVGDVGERDLAERLRLAVGEARLDETGTIDGDAVESTRRKAVLRRGDDAERIGGLRGGGAVIEAERERGGTGGGSIRLERLRGGGRGQVAEMIEGQRFGRFGGGGAGREFVAADEQVRVPGA